MDIDGIHDHTCSIGSKSDNHVVEVVTDYTVLEFGTNLDDIAHSKKETDVQLYEDALITYESVTKNMPGIYSKGMIMIVEGLNAEGFKVQLYWAIHFTNDCNTIPKLGNYSLGWTTFDELEPARCQSCDAIANKNIGPSGKKKKCKKVKMKIPKYKKSGKGKGNNNGKSKGSGKSKEKIKGKGKNEGKGKTKSKGKSIYEDKGKTKGSSLGKGKGKMKDKGKGKNKSKDVKKKHKSYKGSGETSNSKDETGMKSKGKQYKPWKYTYSKSKKVNNWKGKGSADF